MSKGKLYLIGSAFLYGIAPMLAKVTYTGGANGITLTFLRAVISIPLLYAIMKADKKSLKLTKQELKGVILLGVFGAAAPILLLYLSYNFISTGLATTLHFVYPLIIVLVSALLYHEKLSKFKLIASVLVTLGFYVIYIDHSGLDGMDYIKLTFYVMLIMSIVTFLFGTISGSLSFDMTGQAWSFAAVISLIVTLGAMPLFQLGVRYEGASTAGIMSTFEPITSVIMGAAFLGEFIGISQIFGVAMIVAGIVMAQRK